MILIADDEENIRNIVAAFLHKQGFETMSYANGDLLLNALIEMYRSDSVIEIDCIILDIMMPGRNGYEICQLIREFSAVPIIIISAKNSDFDKIKGLRLGSDDYMIKPFSPLELVARVESIIRRYNHQMNVSPVIALKTEYVYGNVRLDDRKKEVFCHERKVDLTQTEFALLSYMMQNNLKAVSREELLKNIWDIDSSISTRVIDDTLKRLRKKLRNVQASLKIETVWGFGFMLEIAD